MKLTDEEILKACDSTKWIAPEALALDIGRAIEAAVLAQGEPVAWATTYMGFPNQFFKEDDAEEQAKAEIERLNREYPQDKHKRAARALYNHPAPVNQALLESLNEDLYRQGVGFIDRIKELEAENANLRTVMMAAAVEIQEHWDAHCDEEGYGPANLLRRLENGYPEQYGYNAETVVCMERRIAELEAENDRLSTHMTELRDVHAKRIAELEAVVDVALGALETLNMRGWILADFEDMVYAAIAKLKEVRK